MEGLVLYLVELGSHLGEQGKRSFVVKGRPVLILFTLGPSMVILPVTMLFMNSCAPSTVSDTPDIAFGSDYKIALVWDVWIRDSN